jgi:penicillin-binding protein 2
MVYFFRRRRASKILRERDALDTDAAFTDSINLPGFDRAQLEGRVVRPLVRSEVFVLATIFALFAAVALYKSFSIQVVHGAEYKQQSEANRLAYTTIFAERGIIEDRFGRKLAWNIPHRDATEEDMLFPERRYHESPAFSHVLGYVEYPKRDKSGNWWQDTYVPKGGIELVENERLSGKNGKYIVEVDARGRRTSGSMIDPPRDGATVQLTLDEALTELLYKTIKNGIERSRFRGGASVVMDVETGEIIAMTSYPSYDLNAFVLKEDQELITKYLTDERSVLMNRAMQGAYAPGSIVKPYMAIAALEEGVVTPSWGIVSTGSISIPNPYNPAKPSIFRDWKAHGFVDMVSAIGVSSDVYFYAVGGGYRDQRGMGIRAIDAWGKKFGFGELTGIDFPNESSGQIPTPEWKAEAFPDEARWTIGNTYHASIGQYGWLATPLQAVRYTAAIANYGALLTPRLSLATPMHSVTIDAARESFQIAHKGMEYSATLGTAKSLRMQGLDLAAKTGTAQVGAHNEKMHSWVIGFWPAKKPKFAFATMYENGKAETLVGAAPSMRAFFETLIREHSPYISGKYPSQESIDAEKEKDEALTEAPAPEETRVLEQPVPDEHPVEISVPIEEEYIQPVEVPTEGFVNELPSIELPRVQ